jgi:hypothetical protein
MNPVSDPPGSAWPTDVSPVKFPAAPYASAASYFDAYAYEISRAAKSIEPAALYRAGALLVGAYARGSRAFSCGNGGWASIASHMQCDHVKGVRNAMRALGVAGATGAKLTGAGGGGFLLVICPMERQRAVQESLADMQELPVKLDRFGSRIVLNVVRDIGG